MNSHLKMVVIDDDWLNEVVFNVDTFCWVITKCCKKMLSGFLVKGERFASHHLGTYAGWEAFSPFAKKSPTFFLTLCEDRTKCINKKRTSFIHTTSKPLFLRWLSHYNCQAKSAALCGHHNNSKTLFTPPFSFFSKKMVLVVFLWTATSLFEKKLVPFTKSRQKFCFFFLKNLSV